MITMNTINHNYPDYHDYHGRTMITMSTMGKKIYGNLDEFPWIDFHIAVTSCDNMTTMGDYHDYHANNGCYQDNPAKPEPPGQWPGVSDLVLGFHLTYFGNLRPKPKFQEFLRVAKVDERWGRAPRSTLL